MQFFVRLYAFVVVCSVLGFHKGFLKFLLGGFVLMDCVACLKHLTLDYELGCGFFLFGRFKQVYEFLGLFLLFGFGFKFLYCDRICRGLVRFLCDLRGKSGEWKRGFCLKYVLAGKSGLLKFLKEDSFVPLIDKMEEREEISDLYTDSDGKIDTDSDEQCVYDGDVDEYDEKEHSDEDSKSDVSTLRKLIKIERQRANAAQDELAKERAASASAAEEAMAMILRLQNEKSLIEMELSQYRRLAEEKQIHDQEVIRSLQWLVWRHESERSSLEEQLILYKQRLERSSKDECEEVKDEAHSSFNGSIWDALENVLYSSRDANSSNE
ncbi:UNVERIFIED_CONTAM: protein FLOURY 1-like [Sesamum latifolium]|uniref:Protein FLOURY 1-like n=1 Tax=Sesamum latifolium TaxID=2727402 RepID=A0AAW2UZY7_9LAMI